MEELIKAYKDNFTIPYSDIERVEMSKGGLPSPTRIRFLTAGKTYSFNLLERKRFGEYVDLIRTISPKKYMLVSSSKGSPYFLTFCLEGVVL